LTLTTSDEWIGKIYVESITTFLALAQQPRLSFVLGEAIDTSGQIVKVLTRQRSMTLDPYGILSEARDGQISISTLVRRALRKRSMPTGLESTK
jgi:hypothetical protein